MSNWYDIDPTPSKATDWLQAIGAVVAVIAALIGFVKLFQKDKDKETEIKSLTDISRAQQENLLKVQLLLEESQKQTQEFVNQSYEMREGNSLYKRHLEILTDSIEHNKSNQEQFLALKKEERKAEIRPLFEFHGAQTLSGRLTISLINTRHTALFHSINNYNENGLTFNTYVTAKTPINTNDFIQFNGSLISPQSTIDNVFLNSATFKFELLFTNEDGNLYKQLVTRVNTKYRVERPEEVESK